MYEVYYIRGIMYGVYYIRGIICFWTKCGICFSVSLSQSKMTTG